MRKLYSKSRALLLCLYKRWVSVHICTLFLWNVAAYLSQSWGYSTGALDSFLLILFEKYAELLKKRFSDDFQEVRERCGSFDEPVLTHF